MCGSGQSFFRSEDRKPSPLQEAPTPLIPARHPHIPSVQTSRLNPPQSCNAAAVGRQKGTEPATAPLLSKRYIHPLLLIHPGGRSTPSCSSLHAGGRCIPAACRGPPRGDPHFSRSPSLHLSLPPPRPAQPGPARPQPALPVLPIEPVSAPAQQAGSERGFLPVVPEGRQHFRHGAPPRRGPVPCPARLGWKRLPRPGRSAHAAGRASRKKNKQKTKPNLKKDRESQGKEFSLFPESRRSLPRSSPREDLLP